MEFCIVVGFKVLSATRLSTSAGGAMLLLLKRLESNPKKKWVGLVIRVAILSLIQSESSLFFQDASNNIP